MEKTNKNISVFKTLENNFHSLSPKKKLIARYLLSNYEEAAFLSADEVALKLNMTPSTVVRFIKEMGFGGYPAFKVILKNIILSKIKSFGPLEKAKYFSTSKEKTIIDSSLQHDLENFQKLLEMKDNIKIKKFTGIILKSNNKFIVANRASFSIGHFFYNALKKLVKNVYFLSNYDCGVFDTLKELQINDVVICFSFPRYSNFTLDLFNYAKTKNVKLLAISDSKISPFFKSADVCLFCPSKGYSFLTSHVASMALINAILSEIFYKNRKETISNLEKEEQILSTFNVVHLKKYI